MTAPPAGCDHRPGKVHADPGDWGVCYSDCTGCGARLITTWEDYGDPDGAAGRWTRWRTPPRTIILG